MIVASGALLGMLPGGAVVASRPSPGAGPGRNKHGRYSRGSGSSGPELAQSHHATEPEAVFVVSANARKGPGVG